VDKKDKVDEKVKRRLEVDFPTLNTDISTSNKDELFTDEKDQKEKPFKKEDNQTSNNYDPEIKKRKIEHNDTQNYELFVANIAFDAPEEGLQEIFESFGKVLRTRWQYDQQGMFRGFGHVTYATQEASVKALDELNGVEVFGKLLRVERKGARSYPATGDFHKNRELQTIFIGNCPHDITNDDVRKLFGKYGNIQQVRWVTDKQTGEFRNCGFIEFADKESAEKVANLPQQPVLRGNQLRIKQS